MFSCKFCRILIKSIFWQGRSLAEVLMKPVVTGWCLNSAAFSLTTFNLFLNIFFYISFPLCTLAIDCHSKLTLIVERKCNVVLLCMFRYAIEAELLMCGGICPFLSMWCSLPSLCFSWFVAWLTLHQWSQDFCVGEVIKTCDVILWSPLLGEESVCL